MHRDFAAEIADQVGCSQRYVSTLREQVRTTSNLPDRLIGKASRSPLDRCKREHSLPRCHAPTAWLEAF